MKQSFNQPPPDDPPIQLYLEDPAPRTQQKKQAPTYPGYKQPCNGCGLCCLTGPCKLSSMFSLWRRGRCRALRYAAGKYWCDVVTNPRRVSLKLSKLTKVDRLLYIGAIGVCDYRAAWSIDEAKALLKERNVTDEWAGYPGDSYPRGAVAYVDGRIYPVIQWTASDDPQVEERTGVCIRPEKPRPATRDNPASTGTTGE